MNRLPPAPREPPSAPPLRGLPATPVDVPAGPVDEALGDWLDAWRRRDWDAMTIASQPSWRRSEDDPRQYLATAWGNVDLRSYTIKKPDRGRRIATAVNIATSATDGRRILYVDVSVLLRCEVQTDSPRYRASRRASIRLVREDAEGQPADLLTPLSFWAVNPISALRSQAGSRHHVRALA